MPSGCLITHYVIAELISHPEFQPSRRHNSHGIQRGIRAIGANDISNPGDPSGLARYSQRSGLIVDAPGIPHRLIGSRYRH